ncbi:S8 family peptidase [Desulfitobacterium sp. Sab5]|uniref:S8 family peptidase n=1 Tax=Desulfitobacterium nosdiversum TaxID=3375356 RepID=UPI003CF0CA30
MSNEDQKQHLWIPFEEVEEVPKKPMNIPEDRGLDHTEHGSKLSQGLMEIMSAYDKLKSGDSLSEEDIMVFKLVLPEGETVAGQQKFIENEGMKINAVKDSRHAIVTSSKSMFQRLRGRVGTYKDQDKLKGYQYIEGFELYSAEEKQATSLKHYLEQQKDVLTIDIQMMFIPHLDKEIQSKAVIKLGEKIRQIEGKLQREPYQLSDGTAVIRALVPMSSINNLANDGAIYRIEQTTFFQIMTPSALNPFSSALNIDPDVDIDSLPVVAVLDTGIEFPPELEQLVPIHWEAPNCNGFRHYHGTGVASKVVFSHIGLQLTNEYLVPRAKVIDCKIYDQSNNAQDVMVERIREAVKNFASITKIFNLSSNIKKPIEGDELSILGYELDVLMSRYKVKFVISAGNHSLVASCSTLEEILEDDEIRIAEPADAMLGITVGSIVGTQHEPSVSKVNDIAPYSRIGPGFAGFYKPDLVTYGATQYSDTSVPRDPFSIILVPGGGLFSDCGTSYTAPVVAGDLAELASIVPENDIFLAQALLYNGAQQLWDTKKMTQEEADYIGNLYGRGISAPHISKFSSPHKVSFLRTGKLNRLTKQRVKFHVPTIQAKASGNNTTRVTITCITDPPIDKTKGSDYLGAYIRASIHKLDKNGKNVSANPKVSDNMNKWDTCYHFSNTYSVFSAGSWEVWLELFTRWGIENDDEIPYALVITVEDLTQENDIYSAIVRETAGRFQPINKVRVAVR